MRHTTGSSAVERIELHQLAQCWTVVEPLVLARDVEEALVVDHDRRVGVVAGPEPEDLRGDRRRRARTSEMSHPWTSPPEFATYTTPSRNATELSIETSPVVGRRWGRRAAEVEELVVPALDRRDDLAGSTRHEPVGSSYPRCRRIT